VSRNSPSIESLPQAARAALRKLADDLSTARKRRGQPLREWAKRLEVSVPTLLRMEKGDPSVSAGVYATAVWLIGRHEALGQVADPKEDLAALEAEIQTARLRGARRDRSV
jgi:hypothetical protein